MIIPLDQRFVADIHGHDDVAKLVRKVDAAFDFGEVFQRVRRQFIVGNRCVEPWAVLVVADFGSQPDAQQHPDRQVVLANQLKRAPGVPAGIIEANEPEIVVYEDLQILEYLGVARVRGAVTAIGMLALAITGIRHRHDLAGDEILR